MTEKLMNQSQGEDIISNLGSIATSLSNIQAISPAKFGMGYAVCDTAASTAAKTANIANYTLTEGALVTVKFTNGSTASNATLNINNTGAKPLLYKGSAITGEIIGAGDICTFIYSTANSGSYSIINIDALSGAGAGTVKSVGAEGGIITDQTEGAAISTTGSVKLNLKSNTAFSSVAPDPVTTEGRIYPVALDSAGHPAVDVPWTDTTYTKAANSAITVDNTNHTIGVAAGTTTTAGVVQLADSYTSTATDKAATPKAVKAAYDLANGKYAKPSGGIPKTDLATAVQTSLTAADNAVPNTRKINNTALSSDITLSGDDIKLTSYTKGSSTAAVAATDKVNAAIAKHENRLDQQNSDLAELQDDVTGLNSSLVGVVNNGAKNEFDINDVYYNKSGIDYSVNDNTGTYTASTTSITYSRTVWNLSLKANVAYKLSFDVTAISTTDKIVVFPTKSSTAQSATWGQLEITQTGHYELEFTPTAEQIWLTVYLNITDTARIVSCTITNLMICTKAQSNTSPTYEPYALGNQVLTPALIEQVDSGDKNKGDFQFGGVNPDQSISPGTITYTVSNGQFTFNGSADASKNYACYLLTKKTIKAGNYIISGCTGGSSTTYRMRVGTGSADTFLFNVTTEPVELNLTSDTIITVQFVVQANTSVSNLNISPMLCTKADWEVSQKFVPYAWTSRNILDSTGTDFQQKFYVDTASAIFYHNAPSHRCIVVFKVKVKEAISAGTALYIGNVPSASYIPLGNVRSYWVQPAFAIALMKNPTNKVVAISVHTGSIPAETELNMQLEWTYI